MSYSRCLVGIKTYTRFRSRQSCHSSIVRSRNSGCIIINNDLTGDPFCRFGAIEMREIKRDFVLVQENFKNSKNTRSRVNERSTGRRIDSATLE